MFEKLIAATVMAAIVAGSFYLFGEADRRPVAVVAATPVVEQEIGAQAMAGPVDPIIEAQ